MKSLICCNLCNEAYGCCVFGESNFCESCPNGSESRQCQQGIDSKFQEGLCGSCLESKYSRIKKTI